MASEPDELLARIRDDLEFQRFVAKRAFFAWVLSLLVGVIYFGFILLIAFNPAVLATPIGDGVTTLGIPIGLGVILSAFALTGIYVWRANGEFDETTKRIIERLK